MIFCLQYLTIKVCNDKPLSINFAVLNFGISNRVQRINKQNTNKQKQRQKIMERSIKKILGEVRAWYVEYKEYRRGKRIARVRKLAKRRSREEVQIMEYGGEMYICYRGVPIVREGDLGTPWGAVLVRSREVYEGWLIEREMEK